MARIVLMSAKELKIPFFNVVPDLDVLKEELQEAPTLKSEWSAPMPIEPQVYHMAGKDDKVSLDRIVNYLEINPNNICCELKDVVYLDGEVVAEVVFSGPKRDLFEEVFPETNFSFIPRYWFDKYGRVRIQTWDVVKA